LLAESLDTVGVFARDVADAALFAGVLAGRDLLPTDLTTPPRVGMCRTSAWSEAGPDARHTFEKAAGCLSTQGVRVTEIDLPDQFDGLVLAQTEIMAYEAAQAFSYEWHNHGQQLSSKLCELIAQGLALHPARYDGNLLLARQCQQLLVDQFRDFDIILAPSTPGVAPEGLSATGDPVFNRIWTLLGTPCVHLPFDRGTHGLPIGVQAIGPWGSDRETLAVAHWVFNVLRTN
jgi:amidase